MYLNEHCTGSITPVSNNHELSSNESEMLPGGRQALLGALLEPLDAPEPLPDHPPTEDRAHLNFTAVFSNTPKNQQCFKKLFKFDPFFVNLRLFRVQPALLHKVNLQMFVNLLFWAPWLLNCPKRGFSLALGGAFF